jgi:outer membrane protein assembly factor BamB
MGFCIGETNKMRRKAIFTFVSIALFLISLVPCGHALSGTVSGVATESDGVNPVVGASVEALQTGDAVVSSTVTGAGGVYSLSLTIGSYKLRVSAEDHITEIEPVVNVTADTITTVNFKLKVGHMLVYDEFMGTSLNASLWDWVLGGWGSVGNATSEPTQFSFVGLSTISVATGFIKGKVSATLDSTIIFEGRVAAYVEAGGPGVYGDGQPRGLRVGTDENNAIEFRSVSGSTFTIEARTVASGVATTTDYIVGSDIGRWNWTYRIEANSSAVKFYLNDVLIATHTTNIPTGMLNIYMCTTWPYGGNVPVSADYLYMASYPTVDWWPTFHHDLGHSGYSTSTAPRTNQTLWKYTTGLWVVSSPAVANGVVYVGSLDNNVYALNAATGALVWNYTTGYAVRSSPAVADNVVYVGSEDDNVYALNATTGALVWNYTTGDYIMLSSPSVAYGKVYIGSMDGNVYALNATTGAVAWKYTTGDSGDSSPAVTDGIVYIGGGGGQVYALDAVTGASVWNYTIGETVQDSPAVVNGLVYVGSGDHSVYALNATTGTLAWKYTTGDYVRSSPTVAYGLVYVGSEDDNVYALNATTGALVWKYTTGRAVKSSPAVADNVVYVGSEDDNVYALNATTGALVWKYTTGYWVWYSSPAVADGIVYIGSNDYNVYAFAARPIPGDINGDGTVNILDAILLSNAFLGKPGDPNWNPEADINGDGFVNILDAIILANHFLQHYP